MDALVNLGELKGDVMMTTKRQWVALKGDCPKQMNTAYW